MYLCYWANCYHAPICSTYYAASTGWSASWFAPHNTVPTSENRLLSLHSNCWIKETEEGGKGRQGHGQKVMNSEGGIGLGWYSKLSSAPQKIYPSPKPQNLWVWLCLEKNVFADVIKLPRWALNPVTSICLRQKEKKTDTGEKATWSQRQTLGLMRLQVKACQQLPEAWRSKERFIPRVVQSNVALTKAWFQTSGFQNCGNTFLSF